MTTTFPRPTVPRPTVPAQPETRSRAVALLTAFAAWVSPGIIRVGWVFGAPVTPVMLRRRCIYTSSTPEGRRSR